MMRGTWRYEECVRKFGAGGKTLMPKTVGGAVLGVLREGTGSFFFMVQRPNSCLDRLIFYVSR